MWPQTAASGHLAHLGIRRAVGHGAWTSGGVVSGWASHRSNGAYACQQTTGKEKGALRLPDESYYLDRLSFRFVEIIMNKCSLVNSELL